MSRPTRDYHGTWTMEETATAYRIMDAAGALLSEVAFDTRPGRGISRDQARRMAEKMIRAGRKLALSSDTLHASSLEDRVSSDSDKAVAALPTSSVTVALIGDV